MKVTVINVVAFKVAWLLTVFAAAAGHGLMGPLAVTCWVGCFLYWQQDLKHNLLFIALAFSVGFLVDMTLGIFGAITFPFSPSDILPPLWMAFLWINLAVSLRYAFAFLRERYVLATFVGAIGGPLAYLSGEAVGAMTVNNILFVAVIWALATPSLLILERATRRAVKVDVIKTLHLEGKRDVGLDAGHYLHGIADSDGISSS